MSFRRVGILGGMGPQATILLMQRVMAATAAQQDCDHIPLLVDQNPQVPSRISHLLEGRGQDPGPVLAAMARGLERAGAEALAMPCNTAHHYSPAIRAAVGLPFIDMIALSVAQARRLAGPGAKVGILASPAVRRVGLYDAALGAAGLKAVYPEDEESLLAAIQLIKSRGPCPQAADALGRASTGLLAAGASVQLIACTEFSLIADAADPKSLCIDTLDELVKGIIAFANKSGDIEDQAEKAPPRLGADAPAI